MAWADLILLAFIALLAVIGIFRGFFGSLIRLCGTFVTLVLAVFLAKPVASVLHAVFRLKDVFAGVVSSPITPYCLETKESGAISNFFVDKFARLLMGSGYWDGYAQGAKDPEFISAFSWKIGELITIIIAAILMFIIIRILISVLTKIVRRLHEYRSIGNFDKVLGFVFGAFKGTLYVVLIFSGVYLISSALPIVGETVMGWMDGSSIASPMFSWVAGFTDSTLLPWLGSIV